MAAAIRLSQQHSYSLDHLVGPRDEHIRQRNGERCCRLEIDRHVKSRRLLDRHVGWLTIAGILTAAIGFSWNPTPLAQALAAIFIACALVHAAVAYGARRALVLFVACNAIAFVMDKLGAATGFPFGVYHFEVC